MRGFDFSNGFNCDDMQKFEKLNNLSINMFEINFYQEQYKWKHKLIPIGISKNGSDRVVDLLVYKNLYVFIKKINAFLGKQDCRFICKSCLNPNTSQQSIPKENTSIKTSPESHLNWKNPFHKNPLYFRIYAVFKADHVIDTSSIGKKTNIYKQYPV